MKNQKLKKILGASGVALVFFVAACRGSCNGFSGSMYGSAPYVGGNGAENAMAGQYSQTEQYAAEQNAYANEYSMIYSMPGMPMGQNAYADSNNNLDLSSAVQASIDSLAYGQYTGQGCSTANEAGYQSMQMYPFMPDLSTFRYPFAPVYNAPSTSREEASVSGAGFFPMHPCMYSSVQDEYSPFVELQRMGEEHRQDDSYTAQPSVSMHTLDKAGSMAAYSGNENAIESEMRDPTLDFIELDTNSSACIWNCGIESHKSIDGMLDAYLKSPQHSGQISTGEDPSGEEKGNSAMALGKRKNNKADEPKTYPKYRSLRASKRKKKEALREVPSTVYQQKESRDTGENGEESLPKEQPHRRKRKINERKKMETLQVSLWNDTRLTNKRRTNYKTRHQTVYKYKYSDENAFMAQEIKQKLYQENIRKGLENFSKKVTSLVKKNPLLYFISSRTTTIATKHKDLLWIRELLKEEEDNVYRKMFVGLEGYYPGVVDDALEYLEKHRPLRVIYSFPPTVWKETLGDVYMRKAPEINYSMVVDQSKVDQIHRRYSAVACALRMILALPEICQDFYRISAAFIQDTTISAEPDINEKSVQVLLSIHTLINEAEEDSTKIEKEHENIHIALESLHKRNIWEEPTASELYKKLYTVLADFYEKVRVFNDDEYILVGKCAIKHQRYVKCEAFLRQTAENPSKWIYNSLYSYEANKWSTSPDVKSHYHVHYVDNALGQPKRLCMPIYKKDSSDEEHYLHAISYIVKHIKILHRIEDSSDVVHPFKVDRQSKKWSYIKEEERDQTVKDFVGYEVVFYRIEKNQKKNFTFAVFTPLYAYDDNVIPIPLFLTPFMQSAVDLGPFFRKEQHKELDSIELENQRPDVYIFDEEYTAKEFSNIHAYYSNLYILSDTEKVDTLDCYVMDCQVTPQIHGKSRITWYVDTMDNPSAYTHFLPNKSFKKKENSKKLRSFIDVVESREHNKDSNIQCIWLRGSSAEDTPSKEKAQKICIWQINIAEESYGNSLNEDTAMEKIKKEEEKFRKAEERQTKLRIIRKKNRTEKIKAETNTTNMAKSRAQIRKKALSRKICEKMSEKPDEHVELMAFRYVNESKSDLGAHNEILDVLITWYNR
ncbi:hypothetical protein NEMIN01_2381 [Nematocida minor]|uniref:uncharacterized protein n=1 Tax=Nematocida minor TaxID=1912983 RepID=UPI00221F38FC|nr:uncharacterized protein NEMIN01_2381 [Nematocida minor]KAI5193046.1 hypothetical protein NEMIN01_2381 [Nematocida minor]